LLNEHYQLYVASKSDKQEK